MFQVALETLLLRGPQKPQTHPLTDYRYTGDWSKAPAWFHLAETPKPISCLCSWWLCLTFQKGLPSAGQLSGHCILPAGFDLPLASGSLLSSAQPGRGCFWPSRWGGGLRSGVEHTSPEVRWSGVPTYRGKSLTQWKAQWLHLQNGDSNDPYLLRVL